MHTPRECRPWGIVSWLADVFCLSRPALYALAQPLTNPDVIAQLPAPVSLSTVTLTKNRLLRTALTASLPGKAALRPTGEILEEAFGRKRSPTWLNELLHQTGVKAGEILRQVDTSSLQNVIVLRDETFFHGQPLLLVMEPVSSVILLLEACRGRQADTWVASLLMSQKESGSMKACR